MALDGENVRRLSNGEIRHEEVAEYTVTYYCYDDRCVHVARFGEI